MNNMNDKQILLINPNIEKCNYALADELSAFSVNSYLNKIVERVQLIYENFKEKENINIIKFQNHVLAEKIIEILIKREFNFQSRQKIIALIPNIRRSLIHQLGKGGALEMYFLYNGGYRASPLASGKRLIFEPDQTELMLLYQVALLQEKVHTIYRPGIKFYIVVNNGVAHWVNDTPLAATEMYARRLRQIIDWLGASEAVGVLLQSELTGFTARPELGKVDVPVEFSDKDQRIVERFLGRSCGLEEAKYRHGLYALAEAQWARDLSQEIDVENGLLLRQVAHPSTMSFRPFPGGAIRTQNGSLGFQFKRGGLSPKLITSDTVQGQDIQCVQWTKPWSVQRQNTKTNVTQNA